jgi:hypothetical protein
MDDAGLDAFARALQTGRSRSTAALLVGGLALGGPLAGLAVSDSVNLRDH